MKKLSYLFLIVVYLFCPGCTKLHINEIPMYGGIEFTAEQNEINEKFIQDAVKQCGDRKTAANDAVSTGWYYYNEKHDWKTAMKRFNQAWLLDPNNAGAFFGFAFIMDDQGKEEEAIRYYEKSIELNPNNAVTLCNLGRIYGKKADKLRFWHKRKEMMEYVDKAIKLYEQAIQVAKTDDDLGYVYNSWAVALDLMSNYVGAWGKIKLARKHDGHYIQPAFIKHLSSVMPEPKE